MVLDKKWSYIISKKAKKEMSAIDPKMQTKILDFLDQIIQTPNPRIGGSSLKGNLRALWRHRVGDYRLLCQFEDRVLIVTVVKIAHRREVYKQSF